MRKASRTLLNRQYAFDCRIADSPATICSDVASGFAPASPSTAEASAEETEVDVVCFCFDESRGCPGCFEDPRAEAGWAMLSCDDVFFADHAVRLLGSRHTWPS